MEMITQNDVIQAQENWGKAIVRIGSLKDDPATCKTVTEGLISELYAFSRGPVLFKPTKASEIQFRITDEGARSYFIGGDNHFKEDHGFALQPWKKVRFVNAGLILEDDRALAMGNYFFTDLDDNEIKVEYTFGYIKDSEGDLKIDLHHSSLPYSG
jgi:hypothetical protein